MWKYMYAVCVLYIYRSVYRLVAWFTRQILCVREILQTHEDQTYNFLFFIFFDFDI